MADEPTAESSAAEARKTIDKLKADLAESQRVIRDLGAKDIAVEHFRSKGVTDPVAAAEIALPHIRDAETPDAMRETLTSRFDSFFPTTAATPPASEEPAPAVENRATPPVPVPSPATPGGSIPSQPEVFQATDPRVQEMVRAGNTDALKQMYDSGQLVGNYKDPAPAG